MMAPSIHSRSRDNQVATVTIRRYLSTNSVVSSPSPVVAMKTRSPHYVAHDRPCRVHPERGGHARIGATIAHAATRCGCQSGTRGAARDQASGSFLALVLR
jgi:hypothetical protein